MTKTLNQLGEATDLDTADLLLARDTSTGDDKRITLNNSRISRHGQTESVTLSSGVLTIPVGHSTIKLPSAVWDGSSNITISGFAFENGVQPEPGYEFALVIPRTGVASAGALGNEVLLQHGTSLQVSANGFADLPCYPNAADNPDTDPVQYAAPYYRLRMRVESYDGSGDPVVSVEELPESVRVINDNGTVIREAQNTQQYFADITLAYEAVFGIRGVTNFSAIFSSPPSAPTTLKSLNASSIGTSGLSIITVTVELNSVQVTLYRNGASGNDFQSGDGGNAGILAYGDWY